MPNLQTFSPHQYANLLSDNGIRKTPPSEKSAKLCKSLPFLQTFAMKSLFSLLARKTGRSETWSGQSEARPSTGKMRTARHHPNRRKSFIFTEKSLPDFSIRYVTTGSYGNHVFCIFCKFTEFLQKI